MSFGPRSFTWLLPLLAACSRSPEIAVQLLVADAMDPFSGPDAATQVRVIIEDDATAPVTSNVGANGSLRVSVQPAQPDRRSRLRIEASRGNTVIATGVTPPVPWRLATAREVAVLMHVPDGWVPGLARLRAPRSAARFVEFDPTLLMAFTFPVGTIAAGLPEAYDLLAYGRAPGVLQQIPGEFDGDSSVLLGSAGALVARGSNAVVFDNNAMTSAIAANVGVPAARATVLHSTAVQAASPGGGWLVGGRDANGAVRRVDHVAPDFTFDGVALDPLGVARDAPDVEVANAGAAGAAPQWFVANGQASGSPWFETYSPGVPQAQRSYDMGADNAREGATMVCAARDATGCTHVLLLGGRVRSAGVSDDVLVDITGVRTGAATLNVVRGAWLARRRWGARAVLAEGAQVVVVGGSDANGPVLEVEALDVTTVSAGAAPSAGRVVGSTACADASVTALSNGAVLVAGGTQPSDGTACTDMAFYRH